MRRVTMATRDELVVAVQERYANGERREKTRILDEFVAVTGFHRKHAVRVLRRKPTARGRLFVGSRPADQETGTVKLATASNGHDPSAPISHASGRDAPLEPPPAAS